MHFKSLFKPISLLFFALALIACSTTVTDPNIGREDFYQYAKWMDRMEVSLATVLDDQVMSAPAKGEPSPEVKETLSLAMNRQLDNNISTLKALNIRHVEVKQLKDMTLHMLTLSKQMMPLLAKKGAESDPKLAALEKEFDAEEQKSSALFRTLVQRFGLPQ
ncbi:hypothetical protein [Otariodibacter oris]|uniref:Lipoprotein n=1 Tax=Otariodibacter oris TaxID=1032623 RepID=A0A420XEJ7_9PAST|nr:hypothetical protein [Otariodibacter oris]QGM80161.1 hypothetical protein A6A10_01430 [Otariodibacter oris]RKR70510.1 hypothetical protein DES31_1954 [Otariodibacter oris]